METITKKMVDVYEIVTNQIIEQLKKGVIPWRKPWASAGQPQNLITKRPYRGINVWLLASLNYKQNYFLSAKQLEEHGGSIKKGQKAHLVVFWKWRKTVDKETGEEKNVAFLRYYKIFNIEQCTGIPMELIPKKSILQNDPIATCVEMVNEMPNPPKILNGKKDAYYIPSKDEVHMPAINSFASSASFYSTLFHELVHSTGHHSRLNRKGIAEPNKYGSPNYSNEELIAEIGASFLNSICGIEDIQFTSNVSYIDGWLKVLEGDKRFVIYASTHAQKAVDYIRNLQVEDMKDSVVETEMI